VSPRRGSLAGLQPSIPENAPSVPQPPAPEHPDSRSTEQAAAAVAAARTAEAVTSKPRKSVPAKSRTSDVRSPEVRTPEVPSSQGPKYLQLERKDTLLWPRQLNELTVLRRVLNRRRPKGAGERITENTLIRLAIDLLIANAGQLQGSTEDELRRSLGLGD
jgi:hypothetical protein